jgi:hypothetical protein
MYFQLLLMLEPISFVKSSFKSLKIIQIPIVVTTAAPLSVTKFITSTAKNLFTIGCSTKASLLNKSS